MLDIYGTYCSRQEFALKLFNELKDPKKSGSSFNDFRKLYDTSLKELGVGIENFLILPFQHINKLPSQLQNLAKHANLVGKEGLRVAQGITEGMLTAVNRSLGNVDALDNLKKSFAQDPQLLEGLRIVLELLEAHPPLQAPAMDTRPDRSIPPLPPRG